MPKRTPLTQYANLACEELFQMGFVCRLFSGQIKAVENDLVQRNRRQPDVPPVTNQPFNTVASRFLGVFQLCRGADLYNWYCRECLRLALQSDPKPVVAAIRNQDGKLASTVKKAEKAGRNPATELIQGFRENEYRNDKEIRKAVHSHLKVMQNPEVELICACRNALVHRRGHDEFGEVAEEIKRLGTRHAFIGAQSYPDGHMPIAIDKGHCLAIDDGVGDWAAELLKQQIFMMDQNFAHAYKLPRKIWERPGIECTFLGESRR
jgi:hypothetical protein